MENLNKIIEQSENKFFRYGFYKTTMDEIAYELRISKKTIYKFFSSKDDLVSAIAMNFMNEMKSKIIPALNSDKNAIEKLGELIKVLTIASEKISSERMEEIKRYYPTLWDKIDHFRTEMMFGNITKVINQGKEEGLFVDYPTQIIMNVLVVSVREVVNPDFILKNNFSIITAARYALKIIIGGILTSKGKKEFNKIFNKVIK